VTNCHQLKMKAADGKMRLTDVADTETTGQIDARVKVHRKLLKIDSYSAAVDDENEEGNLNSIVSL